MQGTTPVRRLRIQQADGAVRGLKHAENAGGRLSPRAAGHTARRGHILPLMKTVYTGRMHGKRHDSSDLLPDSFICLEDRRITAF